MLKGVYKVGDQEYMLFKLTAPDKEVVQKAQVNHIPKNLKQDHDFLEAICGPQDDTEQDK